MRKWALIAAFLYSAAPVQATTYFETKVVCPIGGKTFTTNAVGSSSSWGQRPDGRPYGTLPVWPLPECPGNGFVIFDEKFTSEELAALKLFVASPEYQVLRANDSPYFRAAWLMQKITRSPFDRAGTLLTASWEVDHSADLKARYQSAFIDAALALEFSDEKKSSWFWLRLRAANALRELGRFSESNAALDAIDRTDRLPSNADQLAGAHILITGLRALNVDQNRHSEPANLIPPRMAAERCKSEQAQLSPAEQTACKSDTVRAAEKEMNELRRPVAHSGAAAAAAKAARVAAEAAAVAAASIANEKRPKPRGRE